MRVVEERLTQCMGALAKAEQVRLARSSDKRRVRLGLITVAELLGEPRWASGTVRMLLLAQTGWGDRRVERLLRDVPMSSGRLCGELTQRQRDRVAELITTSRRVG